MSACDRRRFLAGSVACLAAAALRRSARAEPRGGAAATEPLAVPRALEAELGGRIGIMARNTENGATLEWRADERFAMCSTFKWVLAAAILARVERGEVSLEQRIEYDEADLLDYAPVTRARVAEGAMPVADLCHAAVAVSDNTAANLLLPLVGGPAGLTAFFRQHGDAVSRLDREEPELNSNLPGDERDTTTPRAMLDTMERLLLGNALQPTSRKRLNEWLTESTTGRNRLRAGLPDGWTVGDKTGTGANGAANDVAIAWPPGRSPLLIAVYLSGATAPMADLNAAHERIARTVAESLA